MRVHSEKVDEALILEVEGRIDSSNAKRFESALLSPIDKGRTHIIIDLKNLSYISSAGLRVFLMAAKKTYQAGGILILCGTGPQIREVFDVSGFSRLMMIVDTRQEALEQYHTLQTES